MEFPVNLKIARRSILVFLFSSVVLVIVLTQFPNKFLNFISLHSWLAALLLIIYLVIVSILVTRLIKSYVTPPPVIIFDDSVLEFPTFYLGIKHVDINSIYSVEKMHFRGNVIALALGIKNGGQLVCGRDIFLRETEFIYFSDCLEKWFLGKGGVDNFESLLKISKRQEKPKTYTTFTLAIIFIGFYLLSKVGGVDEEGESKLLIIGVGSKDWLIDSEFYRVFSSSFLHIGYIHLMLNLLVLGVLGGVLERVISSIRFANIFLISCFSGYFAFYVFSSYEFGAGASGGLFGLWGAYFTIRLKYENYLPGSVNTVPIWHLYTILFLEIILELFLLDRVATIVHIVGFIAGCTYVLLMPVGTHLEFVDYPVKTEKNIFFLQVLLTTAGLTYFLMRFYGVI